eukprot:Platyproteum_vivax@DN6653_c0_g1_i2.p1
MEDKGPNKKDKTKPMPVSDSNSDVVVSTGIALPKLSIGSDTSRRLNSIKQEKSPVSAMSPVTLRPIDPSMSRGNSSPVKAQAASFTPRIPKVKPQTKVEKKETVSALLSDALAQVETKKVAVSPGRPPPRAQIIVEMDRVSRSQAIFDPNKFRKKKEAGKSKDLLDVCFSDDQTAYTPISLPFAIRDEETTDQRNPRISLKHVDEGSRNASNLLDPANENGFFFIQLPCMLPPLKTDDVQTPAAVSQSKRNLLRQNKLKKAPEGYVTTSFKDLPRGKVGEMVVYKSGKVKLRLGDGHVMDVVHGSECAFSQDFGVLSASQKELMLLGPCPHRHRQLSI